MKRRKLLLALALAFFGAGCEPDVIRPGGSGSFEFNITLGSESVVTGNAVYSATSGVLVVMSNDAGFDLRMLRAADRTEAREYLVNAGASHFAGTLTLSVDGVMYEYLLSSGTVRLTQTTLGRVAGVMDVTLTPLTEGAPYQSITLEGSFNAACSASCFVT